MYKIRDPIRIYELRSSTLFTENICKIWMTFYNMYIYVLQEYVHMKIKYILFT